jgi:hypothetical protein
MSSEVLSIILFNNLNQDETIYYPTFIDNKIYDKCYNINKNFMLKKIEKCFEDSEFLFFCIKREKYMCIIVSTSNFPTRIQSDMANKILNLIENPNAMYGKSAIEAILKTNFEYGMNLQNDKISSVQKEIDGVKDIMIDSIDKVIQRGENIDKLNIKAQNLVEQANKFQTKSYELKKQFCMRNIKFIVIIIFGVCIFIFLIVLIAKK